MSGSPGPSVGGAPWDVGGGEDECARVAVDAALDPPDPEEPFEVGNEYDVVLVRSGAIETIQVVSPEGREVGAVRPHQALLRCLRKGVFFFAVVLSVNGGEVVVRIRART